MTGLLQRRTRLTDEELALVAGLERRVTDVDGGRLKLEWGTLRARSDDAVHDLLWFQDDVLVGFAGLYSFGGATVEVAGMVDPRHRRRGIGSALLAEARAQVGATGAAHLLLVCPRNGAGGVELAARHAATPDHSEHALVLAGEPVAGPTDPDVALRAAVPQDAARVGELLEQGFGFPVRDAATMLVDDPARHVVVERDGRTIGYVRLTLDGTLGGVYGFVIDAALRGRGIGRDVLRRCCLRLRTDGAQRVGLEVATENEHALGLYTSLGFTPVSTEDYFTVTVRPPG